MNFLKHYGLVALSVSLSFSHANAQERVGGIGASGATIGGIATGTIVAGSVAAGVVAAVVSNNRQHSTIQPEQEQAQPGSIKVASVTGKVTLLNPVTGEKTEASADQEFSAPVTIITDSDSTILLVLSNGSSVEVQPGSRIELSTFSQQPYDPALGSYFGLAADPSTSRTNIKVVDGQIAVDVKPLSALSSFHVETPTSSVFVNKGIAFISYDANSLDTDIANVNADVVHMNTQGAATIVPEGQTLNVAAQMDPATGTVVATNVSLTPNSSEVQSKAEALQQTVANQQGASSTPADNDNTTPVTDTTDLIDPTSTEPAPYIFSQPV